jgi:hypothetical protein
LVIKNPPFKSEGRIMAIKDIQGKMSIMDRLRTVAFSNIQKTPG